MRALSASCLLVLVAACASDPRPRAPAEAPQPPSAQPAPTAALSLPPTPPAPSADAASLTGEDEHTGAHASNAFTAKLYARLKRAPGNLMVSGASARHALALAALGARGDTAREMLSALEAPAEISNSLRSSESLPSVVSIVAKFAACAAGTSK